MAAAIHIKSKLFGVTLSMFYITIKSLIFSIGEISSLLGWKKITWGFICDTFISPLIRSFKDNFFKVSLFDCLNLMNFVNFYDRERFVMTFSQWTANRS